MMKKIIFGSLMILAVCLGGAKAYIDHQLLMELDNSKKIVADKVIVNYSKVSTSLLGSIIINDLQLSMPDYTPVHIDTVTLYKAYQFYDLNQLPQDIKIAFQGVQFSISDTDSPPPVLISAFGYAPYYLNPRELRGLGFTRVNANINIEAKSSGGKMSLVGEVNAHAWGVLNFSVDLNNVSTLAKLTTAVKRIKLAMLTFSYVNKGLINQILTRLAQRNTMSPNTFKPALIAKLKNDIRQTKMILDTSVFTSLQQFIQTPNILTVHLQPNPPVTINSLFLTSPRHLGLKMTTTKSH